MIKIILGIVLGVVLMQYQYTNDLVDQLSNKIDNVEWEERTVTIPVPVLPSAE